MSKPGAEPLVTVVYGPEWQTIEIIDRRIIDGTLRCVVYSGAAFDMPAALAEPTTWYETKDAKPIETYRRIRRQLSSGGDVGRQPGVSSNPVIKMHLLDDSGGGVLLEFPWSTRGIHRLAAQTILSEAVFGKIDDGSSVDIQRWVDPFELASGDLRAGLFEFPAEATYYASVFLEYFDLQHKLAWELERSGTRSESDQLDSESEYERIVEEFWLFAEEIFADLDITPPAETPRTLTEALAPLVELARRVDGSDS